ncbi:MAG: rRNA pseudouridine synthase [Zetaproteobacteria bacterium]|nr:rRNA pseudouridine synthase [Zetaproteobacteria bacterium]
MASQPRNEKKSPERDMNIPEVGERINRYLAQCGICSRREADRLIEAGKVTLNGTIITTPGVRIMPKDKVCVEGELITLDESHTYILYYKPRGLMCSRSDAKGRPLIYDQMDVAANVQSVGRLDMDSEGLLILTNDGKLAQVLTHPSSKIPRQYRVRIAGILSLENMEKLRHGGIDMGDGDLSEPWEFRVDAETRGHCWITVTIHQGRWREIRRTLDACGHPVRRLIRTSFGPIKLDEGMPSGARRPLNSAELRKLQALIQ